MYTRALWLTAIGLMATSPVLLARDVEFTIYSNQLREKFAKRGLKTRTPDYAIISPIPNYVRVRAKKHLEWERMTRMDLQRDYIVDLVISLANESPFELKERAISKEEG